MSDYDLFVIGGGSGGLSAAKRAAHYGARVAIAEPSFLGGTCAARGCIPKKLMVYASRFSRLFEDAAGYGWSGVESRFDWQQLMRQIHAEIKRLDATHAETLDKAGITLLRCKARFVDAHTLGVDHQKITAEKILIAVGGKAIKPDIPGIEHALISDQMFHLETQPRRMGIVGGGYIGVEFAGIMQGLGTQVTQIVREDGILHQFDALIQTEVQKGMSQHGIQFLTQTEVTAIEKDETELSLTLSNSSHAKLQVDAVLFATGRTPNLSDLELEKAGVEIDGKAIAVNANSQTSQPHIYAVGDCTNRKNLTPVAIATGRAFADTVFGQRTAQVGNENIPSSVFGQPQAAFVGLTEAEAEQKLGRDNMMVYCAMFEPLFHHLTQQKEPVLIKLIVHRPTDRVVGVHMVGENAAEIIQMAAIAVTAKLTKADFDATMALHPTTAEELVNLRLTAMPQAPTPPCWM